MTEHQESWKDTEGILIYKPQYINLTKRFGTLSSSGFHASPDPPGLFPNR